MNIDDLDRWMALSGTSENRLAHMVGVSRTAVMWWRNGMKLPTEQHAIALENAVETRNQEMMLAIGLSMNKLPQYLQTR